MISHIHYMELPKRYLADPASEFMSFGEWFCRNYLKHDDAELFYEKELLKAGAIIGMKYVKKEKE
jgi:hypothetical protein